MLRFLFWNLNRKPLENLVRQIVGANDVDIVILAEMDTTPHKMAAELSGKPPRAVPLHPAGFLR